jgi:hypothetical protein
VACLSVTICNCLPSFHCINTLGSRWLHASVLLEENPLFFFLLLLVSCIFNVFFLVGVVVYAVVVMNIVSVYYGATVHVTMTLWHVCAAWFIGCRDKPTHWGTMRQVLQLTPHPAPKLCLILVGKVKLSLCLTKHHAMKTCWGVEVWLHAFFYLGIRWRWVVSFTSQPLYPQGNTPPPVSIG